MQYLLSWVEETMVGSLEFALTDHQAILGLHTLREASSLSGGKAE